MPKRRLIGSSDRQWVIRSSPTCGLTMQTRCERPSPIESLVLDQFFQRDVVLLHVSKSSIGVAMRQEVTHNLSHNSYLPHVQVLQLPIVKSKVKRMMNEVVKKMGMSASPQIPSSDDPLEIFLATTGKFFGKDPSEWFQVGEPQIEVTEEGGKRYIKSTGIFSGLELHMFYEPLYFDERMTKDEDKPEEMDFSERRKAVVTDEQWHEIMRDQPWTMSRRRLMLTAFLQAKMESGDVGLMVEGCHGLWELSINKVNHHDVKIDRMASLIDQLNSPIIECATISAAAVWGFATSAGCRKIMSDLDVISMVVGNIKRSLKANVIPDPPPGSKQNTDDSQPSTIMSESQRATMQKHLLGALAMLLVDRCCRKPYVHMVSQRSDP